MHAPTARPSAAAEFVERQPFRLGTAEIDPATRRMTGPGGTAAIEPRVLQVLIALTDADGAVVTRELLNARCWDGLAVGDDALNRTVFEARRLARTIAAGSFVIETIPRTGYRLLQEDMAPPSQAAAAPAAAAPPAGPGRLPRRAVLAGAAAAAVGGGWLLYRNARQQEHAAVREAARVLLREGRWGSAETAIGKLDGVLAEAPDDAATLGLLALAWREVAADAMPANVAAAEAAARRAAARALAIDPRQGEALTARATLLPSYGDWAGAFERLRLVLAVVPDNAAANLAMAELMAALDLFDDQAPLVERLVARAPDSLRYGMLRLDNLWARGDQAGLAAATARAVRRWPEDDWWMKRAKLLAAAGQPAAAAAVVEHVRAGQQGRSRVLETMALTMQALADGTQAARTRAIDAAVAHHSIIGTQALYALTVLGALDQAFGVADAVLPPADTPPAGKRRHALLVNQLFMPPMARLRADPRFVALMRRIGLLTAWHAMGTRPDYLAAQMLPL